MKLATVFTAIAIAAAATTASADQLAKSAGVPSGIYSNTTLVAIIDAKVEDNDAKLSHLLGQTVDSVRVSSRGNATDFGALINQAEQDNDSAKVSSLTSLSNGDNFDGGIDFARLINQAEQDGEYGKAAALRSRAGF